MDEKPDRLAERKTRSHEMFMHENSHIDKLLNIVEEIVTYRFLPLDA